MQGSGDRAGHESWLSLTSCVTSHLSSLSLSFLICKVGIIWPWEPPSSHSHHRREDTRHQGRPDLSCFPGRGGLTRSHPVCPGAPAPALLRQPTLGCALASLGVRVVLSAGPRALPSALLVLESPGGPEVGHCEGDQLSQFAQDRLRSSSESPAPQEMPPSLANPLPRFTLHSPPPRLAGRAWCWGALACPVRRQPRLGRNRGSEPQAPPGARPGDTG